MIGCLFEEVVKSWCERDPDQNVLFFFYVCLFSMIHWFGSLSLTTGKTPQAVSAPS